MRNHNLHSRIAPPAGGRAPALQAADIRGQALILAVMAVIVVIAVAALFVAVVAANLAHTSRQSDVVELRQIAEAGVRYASDQLSHSVEGADWRPTTIDIAGQGQKPVFNYGHGSFELQVNYAPSAANGPLSRFINITSIASLVRYYDPPGGSVVYEPDPDNRYENPLVKHTLVAYKPILITDYLQFITNASQTGQPAEFGVNNIEVPVTGDPTKSTVAAYTLGLPGPVRVNTDLVWRGTTDISLTISDPTYLRDDKVEVAGQITQPGIALGDIRLSANAGPWTSLLPSRDPVTGGYDLFTTVGGLYRDGVQAYTLPAVDPGPTAPYPRYVRYEVAPDLGLGDTYTTTHGRYRSLTRFTGPYLGAPTNRYLGEYGTGDGVYVSNSDDVEYNHDYISQRNAWTDPTFNYPGTPANPYYWNADPPSDSWFPTRGRLFTPPGCEIVLHPAGQYGVNVPYIEIIRHDDPNPWSYWNGAAVALLPARTYPDLTTPLAANTLVLPYPMDGVIFAEGNIRIRGDLPPATNSALATYYGNPLAYNLSNIADQATLASWADSDRYYDLTVVSNGNIYVDGPLRTPLAAGLIGVNEEQRNTKIALLARDSVVLNTTQAWPYRLRRDPSDSQTTVTDTKPDGVDHTYWHVTSADPLTLKFNINGLILPGTRLFLRHAGYTGGDGGPPPAPDDPDKKTEVQLTINGTPYDWNGSTTFYFVQALYDGQVYESSAWYDRDDDTGFERRPDAGPGAAEQEMNVTSYLQEGENTLTFRVTGGMYDYVLAQVEILPPQTDPTSPMPIPVEALIYAQDGAWFVLPGPWFDDTTDADYRPPNYWVNNPGDPTPGFSYPAFHEPVNARIALFGALSANQTASVGDVRDYTSKWHGPTGAPATPPFLYFSYDPTIRTAWYSSPNGGLVPRLPKLPVAEQLIIWGEQY